ncbi:hypothetical protein [Streptomyces cylindrosporus]|uniref:Serine/threonine protein kinase n=1 Tax=Streptomyces cylindrosporus TaxID=2927583 RepID=A0ABS9Y2P7_9ACTN|nr:hypothetical protein [Streptomyces cylindrosporus]MCI3271492.1 hypothetical protein [Streptomyces cylindrosporus]
MRGRGDTAQTEERVRLLLGPADPVAGEAAPDAAVLERILAEDPRARRGRPRSHRPSRRRWVIGVAVIGVLGVGGLAAQATGVIPGDVDWGLNRAGHGAGSEGMAPDSDKAEMLFSGTAPDGTAIQYWEAPNPSGGLCHYMRVLAPDGKPARSGGWSECIRGGETFDGMGALWSAVDTNALSDWVAVYGRVPQGAVAARVVWAGGRTEGPMNVGRDRYFVAFLPYNSRSNEEWMREYRTEALDAHGRVVAVVHSDR